jgi:hypothetical protein
MSLTMSLNVTFETRLVRGVAHNTKDEWASCNGQHSHA